MPLTHARSAVAAVAAALALAACGAADDGDDDAAAEPTDAATSEVDDTASGSPDGMDDMSTDGDMSGDDADETSSDMAMDDMSDMDMGSADAPRADEVDADELRRGDLEVLDAAPEAFAGASGTALLALGEMTWVTVDVAGLAPGTGVVGHLHAESCATDGGPHHRFDPDGGDTPPNEVHVAGTTDDAGALTVSVTNDMVASDALSLVLHATDGDTTRALCADLAGAGED